MIGVVEDRSALSQTRARAGDRLVLTKPLGFGIAAQAIKKGRLSDAQLAQAVAIMTTLNKAAKDAALAAGAHAATDVTGFGLLGHLHHLAIASGLSARVFADAVPTLDFVRSLAAEGMVPGGSKDNLAYVEPHASFDSSLSEVERLILADAQTSGGLLIAVPPEAEASLFAGAGGARNTRPRGGGGAGFRGAGASRGGARRAVLIRASLSELPRPDRRCAPVVDADRGASAGDSVALRLRGDASPEAVSASSQQISDVLLPEKGDVAALIPLEARAIPVMPEVEGVVRRRETVRDARVEVAPRVGHTRRVRQRGDHAQQLLDPIEADPHRPGDAQQDCRCVAAEEPQEVDGGDPRDHAIEVVLEGRQQRGGVAAQGDALNAHARRALGAQPCDQASDVPDGLGLGVDGVEEVARQVAVTAPAAHPTRAVERHHGDRDIEAQVPVEPARTEAGEVDGRVSHPVAGDADDPGPVGPGVPHRPGVGGAVRRVFQEAPAARLSRVGFVATLEAQMLEGSERRSDARRC